MHRLTICCGIHSCVLATTCLLACIFRRLSTDLVADALASTHTYVNLHVFVYTHVRAHIQVKVHLHLHQPLHLRVEIHTYVHVSTIVLRVDHARMRTPLTPRTSFFFSAVWASKISNNSVLGPDDFQSYSGC